jgi:membrane protease YdiL (CAAX protease family)
MSFPVMWFGPNQTETWVFGFFTLAECFAITISVFYARRFFDKRTFSSLGLSFKTVWVKDIIAGISIAAIMMGSIFTIAYFLNWINVKSFAWESDGIPTAVMQTVIWLTIFVLVGWQEELLSRGYHLQNLADGINITWGVILSSLVFAVLHIFNPGASWISTFGILLAGLFLSLGYILTKQLWLPIGLHIGWNFFEGVVFGFPVSGMTTYKLVLIDAIGPETWTGGEFGPEAGLLLLPAMLLGVLIMFLYSKYRVKHD